MRHGKTQEHNPRKGEASEGVESHRDQQNNVGEGVTSARGHVDHDHTREQGVLDDGSLHRLRL